MAVELDDRHAELTQKYDNDLSMMDFSRFFQDPDVDDEIDYWVELFLEAGWNLDEITSKLNSYPYGFFKHWPVKEATINLELLDRDDISIVSNSNVVEKIVIVGDVDARIECIAKNCPNLKVIEIKSPALKILGVNGVDLLKECPSMSMITIPKNVERIAGRLQVPNEGKWIVIEKGRDKALKVCESEVPYLKKHAVFR